MLPPLLLLLLGPRAQGQVQGSGDQGLEDIKGHESGHQQGQEDGPMACLGTGACYQGSYATTSTGRRYASYQGVRYARPPVGSLRFLAPEPFLSGEGLWDVSTESTIACPQKSHWLGDWQVVGQEDCLFLNVYTPETEGQQEDLPVMVWIHGGALLAGSNTFQEHGPQHLLDREVVVVTVNYRLGALGFLCMGTEKVPGNAGLRDQSLALHWVRDNIGQFGGDAGRVTVFGESAGSSSVALQLVSPLSSGTFQRCVLQSGSALGISWGAPNTPRQALGFAELVAKGLGCDEEDRLSCLQGGDLKELLELTDIFPDQTGWPWQAVPDSSFTAAPFLPAPAEELLQAGHFNKDVEVIIGTNKDEGLDSIITAWSDPDFYSNVRDNWDTLVAPRLLGLMRESDVTAADIEKSREILDFYVGGLENITEANVQGLIDMMTDSEMLYGVDKTVGYLLEQGVTAYQYILSHRGQFSVTQMNGGPAETHGVSHADDLLYEWEPVFGRDWDTQDHRLEGQDVSVREILTSAWAEFARTGDPSPPGAAVNWRPVAGLGPRVFLNISGPQPSMDASQDIADRMDLWRRVVG